MKRLPIISGFIVATMCLTAFSETVVELTAKKTHAPTGFDSNDETEVIITGDLPNTCIRRPRAHVEQVSEHVIEIKLTAEKIELGKNSSCIDVVVPYLLTVPLGQLEEGVYSIQTNTGTSKAKTVPLTIDKPGASTMDNFTYADVQSVKRDAVKKTLVLEGIHPSSCMEIERVELIPNDAGDTISVLPIVRQVELFCDQVVTPFSYEVPFTSTEKNLVLHIRTIQGTALNIKL